MADNPIFNPNPLSVFDPSQWRNPYSQYAGKALPWPTQYVGVPNDAMGQPIQPPPGMTINSPPPAPAAPAAPSPVYDPNSLAWANNAAGGYQHLANSYDTMSQTLGQLSDPAMMATSQHAAAMAAINRLKAQAAPLGAGVAQVPQAPQQRTLSANDYLSLLANPGPVVTPGATVSAAQQAYQPSNGVLQQFLANWQPAQSGVGSGFQQVFNRALRGSYG